MVVQRVHSVIGEKRSTVQTSTNAEVMSRPVHELTPPLQHTYSHNDEKSRRFVVSIVVLILQGNKV